MERISAIFFFSAIVARAEFSWQRPHANVRPTGAIEWAPERFVFEPAGSVRYIDYENGDDRHDGCSPATAWKHHPLDPEARAEARDGAGAHSFVFKGGVMYRGRLRGRLEGTAEQPVVLTRDPAWGTGPAVLSGSERVTGWTQGAQRNDMPEPEKVWRTELPFAPRRLWLVRPDDEVVRLPLARMPNWTASDPDDVMSEWWSWEQPEWWTDRNKTTVNGRRMHLGVDRRHLTGAPEDYVGGVVWSEWGIVMGTPFASRIEAFDADQKAIAFQGFWYDDSGRIITGNRYFLEDRPNFLDAPGEFWFDRTGEGGTLYLRLPDDADPNGARIEAARRINLVDLEAARHLRIEGLTFQFTNVFWDLTARGFVHRDVEGAAIRLLGSGENLRIAHCRFEHVQKAVRLHAISDDAAIERVVVADNDIAFTDHGAIEIADSSRWEKTDPPFGELGEVNVWRNRLREIGHRPFRSDSAHALVVRFPETLEAAGNVLDRCYGAGIFIFGGKGSDETRDRPLCRLLIHHNQVVHSLLAANDWGGIETWQGGPAYVFNNVSGDPNGYWNWAYRPDRPASARLGFAYYLDGAFKNYYFNNIAWGVSNDLTSRRCSHTAFYQATPTTLNLFAHNTAWQFADGSAWSPVGGRQLFLGNLWLNISRWVFHHGKQKEDGDVRHDAVPWETIGYAHNVFFEVGEKMAFLEGGHAGEIGLESMRELAVRLRTLASDVGRRANVAPVRDAVAHDFRPLPSSAAVDAGVRFFVPWGLARVVGEWPFYRHNADPAVGLDEHWYMSPRVVNRNEYWRLPRFDLRGIHIAATDYVEGPLEDWTAGAVRLNGRNQYFVWSDPPAPAADGFPSPRDVDRRFIVETVFHAARGGGALVSDLDERGYELFLTPDGRIAFQVQADVAAKAISPQHVTDGAWHHVLAEADLDAGFLRLYLDGRLAVETPARLEGGCRNAADLCVGRGAAGFFAGEIDFLRLALGTLADSKTTIEELYAWQFDGPFLRDFTGATPTGARRDAGAIELRP